MSAKMKNFYYRFDTCLPLYALDTDSAGDRFLKPADKLYDLGLERYTDKAFRNTEVKVCVRFPEGAGEYGLIELPEQKRHHSGFLIIPMDESIKEAVTFELVDKELRELDLLSVEYLSTDEPGKILAVLEMRREVALVDDFRISLPSVVRGEPTANVSLAVDVSNVVGTQGPGKGRERGRSHGRPRNHRLRIVNNYGLNTKMDRKEGNSDVEYRDPFFWPAECSLVAKVDARMLLHPEDLVRKEGNALVPIHEAVYGAHPEILRNIYDGHFENIYLLPEVCPRLGRKGRRELVMYNFPQLVQAWDNNRVSESLDADKFAAKTEEPNDFYCCMGEVDQVKGTSRVNYACFGRTPSIHKVTWRDGRRMTVRDEKGKPKYTHGRGGYLVLIPFKPMFQMMAVLYAAMVNGKLDSFYEEHGLLFPDTLFAEEDWDALQEHKDRRRKANEERQHAQAESAGDDEGEDEDEVSEDDQVPNSEASASDEEEDAEELDVGDWGVADADDGEDSTYSGGPPATMDPGSETDGTGDEPEQFPV
ncbi:hypothetical protein GF391_00750 [Candidatus Uhrbacteria bacterium]|nr:hypothetical protein [Candidatus Uhrbacteria bacterium]